jgi:hypothetical protein
MQSFSIFKAHTHVDGLPSSQNHLPHFIGFTNLFYKIDSKHFDHVVPKELIDSFLL